MDDPFLNPYLEIDCRDSGILPHWDQDGKMQFVTFRLIDSLPQSKIHELKALKEQFLTDNPKPWSNHTTMEYYELISPFESELLDRGYGSCILKNKGVRAIVSKAMKYLDGNKYELMAFVIMPNHIHILFQLFEGIELETVMHTIKSFSSHKINKFLTREGKVWMKEYFDRMVRTEKHLINCIRYIISNPEPLKAGEYELYLNPSININDIMSPITPYRF